MKTRRIFLIIGAISIVAAGIWQFGISNRFKARFPDNWIWEVSTLGQSSWADFETGEFPEPTLSDAPINITERTVSVNPSSNTGNAVEIQDHYVTKNPATGVADWEFTFTALVDPVTGKHADEQYANDYFLFPRNVEKTTYNIRNTSYQGIPVEFEAEESISGINTYHFVYRGDLNNNAAYPDVELEDGQEITCFDFELSYWVEPTTGEVVKYREWCEGDYVVDTASGERLYGLSRWGGENTGDDLIARTAVVRAELMNYNWMTRYIPILLLFAGLILVIVGLIPKPTAQSENKGAPA